MVSKALGASPSIFPTSFVAIASGEFQQVLGEISENLDAPPVKGCGGSLGACERAYSPADGMKLVNSVNMTDTAKGEFCQACACFGTAEEQLAVYFRVLVRGDVKR